MKNAKDLNEALYMVLKEVHHHAIHNNGELDVDYKQYGYMADAMDELEVLYFEWEPDGSRAEELKEQLDSGLKERMTDEEAFTTIVTRLKNGVIE